MKNIIVKESRIEGKGVFAAKNFKKGDIVLEWKPKILKKSELKNCSDKDLHYVYRVGKKLCLCNLLKNMSIIPVDRMLLQ